MLIKTNGAYTETTGIGYRPHIACTCACVRRQVQAGTSGANPYVIPAPHGSAGREFNQPYITTLLLCRPELYIKPTIRKESKVLEVNRPGQRRFFIVDISNRRHRNMQLAIAGGIVSQVPNLGL